MKNQSMRHKKIALGLSGGVDSAVSAHLLKKQGYDITAVYLECWNTPGCRAEQDRQDALEVALQLDIPFQSLDFSKQYKEKVMSYFLTEYQAGRTPNPDVLCNSIIKFGMFYDWAMEQGFDAIATGHYAQIKKDAEKKSRLLTAKDLHKDQTYFLHQIKQEQLDHIVFPIGQLLKAEVREVANQVKLPVAAKKDSVGICFVGEINVHEFLEENLGKNPGEVVTSSGDVVGEHEGLWFYTIGQRKGFNIFSKAVEKKTDWLDESGDMPPLFVIDKNQEKNQLVVGRELETKRTKWQVHNLHKIDAQVDWPQQLFVRIRHTGELVSCTLKQVEKNLWEINSSRPLKGLASGQFSVFYAQDQSQADRLEYGCLGGGTTV